RHLPRRSHMLDSATAVPFCLFVMLPAATQIYTLSLHDALPISFRRTSSSLCSVALVTVTPPTNTGFNFATGVMAPVRPTCTPVRSEEHTSELQSRRELVCRLLLEKKSTRRPRPRSSA